MTDPAEGSLTLTGTSALPTLGVRAQSYAFTGVVAAPGLPATAVEVHGLIAPADKWPQPGAVLPVVVDRAEPEKIVIRWDQIATGRDVAVQQAEGEALRRRTGLEPDVLAEAVAQNRGAAPAVEDAPVAGEWTAPTADHPVVPGAPMPGTVVGVREAHLPPGLAPAGGVWDLTIQLADTSTTVVTRARFATAQDRDRTAHPGAEVQVLVDHTNPTVATLST